MEQKILASLIKSRDAYISVMNALGEDDLSATGQLVLREIHEYYDRDDKCKSADFEVIKERVLRKYGTNPKLADSFEAYLTVIGNLDVSVSNIVAEVLENKLDVVGMALSEAIHSGNDRLIHEYLAEYNALLETSDISSTVEESYRDIPYEELYDLIGPDNCIQLAPPALDQRVGGRARRGHHILVFAMSEVGKTMMAVVLTDGFARQNLKVLYIGNEDPIPSIIVRTISCMSGKDQDEIEHDPESAMKLARERGYGNITFLGMSNSTVGEIESVVRRERPDCLIIDQLLNVGAKGEHRTNELELAAKGMRDIARKYNCLVVSVTQAAESARNKLYLDTGDVYNSNVGVPGQCDVMIGMGMNEDYYNHGHRMLSLCKNKLSGDHGHIAVNVTESLSRVYAPRSSTYAKSF